MAEKEEDGGSKASEVVPMFFFDLIARVVPGLFLLFGIYLIAGEGPLGRIGIHHVINKMKGQTFASMLWALLGGYITGHMISPLVKTLDNWAKNRSLTQEERKQSLKELAGCLAANKIEKTDSLLNHVKNLQEDCAAKAKLSHIERAEMQRIERRLRNLVENHPNALNACKDSNSVIKKVNAAAKTPAYWKWLREPTGAGPSQRPQSSHYNDLRLLCPSITNITMRIRAEYIMYGGFCVAFAIFFFLRLFNLKRES